MRILIWTGVTALAWFGIVSTAGASPQRVIDIIDGDMGMNLGFVRSLPDADGDGRDDLLIYGDQSPGFLGSIVTCYSSRTLQEIWRTQVGLNLPAGSGCGRSDTRIVGDFDGDGDTDVVVGCPSISAGSTINILDGKTGQIVFIISNPLSNFGRYLGAPGDTNGDGFADIIVINEIGERILYLGPNGVVRHVFPPPPSALVLGAGGLGDLDFDGCDDFALGLGAEGRVEIYSGRNLSLMTVLCPDPAYCGGYYGFQPTALGDITGDQVPDFALAAGNLFLPAGFGGLGVINIISGADFSTIHQIHGRPMPSGVGEFMGSYLSGGHDVNGDGVADVVATATATQDFDSGVVISGRTGQILYQVRPAYEGGILDVGGAVYGASTIPDIDGDGYDDWTVSNPRSNVAGQSTGRIYILAGGPGDVEAVCDAQPHSQGHPAQIHFYGAITEFGRGLEIRVDEAIPDSFAYIVFGPRSAPQPLGDGVLCIDSQSLVRYGSPRPLNANGMLRRDVDWGEPEIGQGPSAWTAGASWTVQAIFRDGGGVHGFNSTNAIEVTVNQ